MASLVMLDYQKSVTNLFSYLLPNRQSLYPQSLYPQSPIPNRQSLYPHSPIPIPHSPI
ncbi:MAG: hypothetical protein ACRCT1_07040 [Microcoleaceae cyanobacterium]